MDKIKTLLEQLGSKELAGQIVESLEQFKTKKENDIKEEYTKRLDRAKEACLEEVRTYKQELSRKVQIFFESRAEKIDQQIAKQVAIKDSVAEAKLQSIVALLEGVEVNSKGNNTELKAAIEQIRQLQEQSRKLSQDNRVIAEKANRAHAIAEKTLERNKVLAKELEESIKANEQLIAEAKSNSRQTVVEGKGKPAAAISEARKPAAQPVTTRRTDQSQLAVSRKTEPVAAPGPTPMAGYSPESVAANMGE